jgi:ABC-2 type transport system permease protein
MLLAVIAMVPFERFSPTVQTIGKILPLASGVKVLNLAMAQNKSFLWLIQSGDFFVLILNSMVYLFIGIVVFHKLDSIARQHGLLAHY